MVNEQTGAEVASVKTARCGDFFFENLPKASYIVKFGGEFLLKNSYDIALDKNGTYDIAGELLSGNNHWTIKLNAGLAENPNGGEKVNAGLHAAGSALSQGAALLGGALPGGAVISAAVSSYSPGDPIPGLDVKLLKESSDRENTSKTNEKGQFEFIGLSQGNYTLSSTFHFNIDGSIPVSLWLSKKGYDYYKAQSDMNKTSEESTSEESEENKPKNNENGKEKKGLNAINVKTNKSDAGAKDTSDEAQRKGWDGTVKGGNRIETLEQDGSEKLDKSALTTAIINLHDFKNSLADVDKLKQKDKRPTIASSKITPQINNVRNRISQLENSLKNLGLMGKTTPALNDLDAKLNAMDNDFFSLLENLGQMGDQYSSISNVLKTKHDTAKNSVGNIR
ncbi:MAG: carboxypeptidase-like regulatory domain-containing protein [Lutibacter sp.]|nr:carboxypeptidase-like regulatory domain-containing protein [Lutibacter sp.]